MKKKLKEKKPQSSAIFEELEPRLLFSAGVEGLVAGDLHTQGVTEFVVDDKLQLLRAANSQEDTRQGAHKAVDSRTLELVFIDAATPDKERLLNDLLVSADAGNRQFEVIELAADSDGVLQISATLENYQNVAAIHIVSHGSDAELRLGNSALNAGNFASYQDTLRSWAQSLDVNADILIYGCNLAASAAGQGLIDGLSSLTGADVAASTDVTGNVSLGGDWELEYRVGAVSTPVALSFQAQATWVGTLDITSNLVLHNTFDTDASDSSGNNYDGTLTNGALIDTNGGTNQIGDGKLSLDGINDYVDLSAHAGSFQGFTEGTISVWVFHDVNDRDVIFEMSDSGDSDSRLALFRDTDGSFDFYIREGSTTLLDVSTAAGVIPQGTWTHVAVTVDGGGNKLYVNGVQQGGLTYATGSSTTNRFFDDVTQLDFASWGVDKYDTSNFTRYFNGLLDDGRIYDRALAASDITELYSYTGANATTTAFQQGDSNGYSSTVDTFLNEGSVTQNNSTNVDLQVDLNDGAGDGTTQALIRFDNIFGNGPGQIPVNAMITSATLTVNVNNLSDSGATISMHEMLSGWSDTDTWSSMSSGVSINNIEASATADSILANPAATGSVTFTGLESRIQSWIDGASTNSGWVIVSDSTNGWDFDSSESGTAPILSVTYVTAGLQTSTEHTLTVDTADDVIDGDATSIDALLADKGADGKISLREAILAANNTSNVDASTPDVINFAIGSGAQTISVGAGGLPLIEDAVVLDATTQPGYSGIPLITLDGTNATGSTGGIVLRTNNSTVSGFIVQNFPDEGIEIDGSTGYGDNNVIEDNWIGITVAGVAAGNGDDGILVTENADNNQVRNNIVAASGGDGIHVRNNSIGNWIWGNTVGLGIDGITLRPNAANGVYLSGTTSGTIVGTDANGTNDAAERNVIGGNQLSGVYVDLGSNNESIAGNYIGVAADGTTARGNLSAGITIMDSNNTIGGAAADAGNLISGNAGAGIHLAGNGSNVVQGNYIGTDASGTAILANSGQGIYIESTSGGNIIGGAATGAGNLISGNNASNTATSAGIYVLASGNTIQGNLVGTDITGTQNLANDGAGIALTSAAASNLIGGTDNASGNIIGFNNGDGVRLFSAAGSGNSILGNEIFLNGGNGIDLQNNGVTANDSGDGDTGPNNLQNFPLITSADRNGIFLILAGSLDTDGLNTQYLIEFYGNASGTEDPTHGEGRYYLGSTTVMTDGAGDATFSNVSLPGVTLTEGDYVTATATVIDAPGQVGIDDQLAYGSTSEFAANSAITSSNTAPSLNGVNNLTSINEDPVSNPGTLVSALIAGHVTDPDAGAVSGIAVTAVDNSNGVWEYTIDGGSNWNPFGAPADAAARLLADDANTLVRFVPAANWNGSVTNGLTFRAWDQFSGTHGGTADTSGPSGTILDDFSTVSYSNDSGTLTGRWTTDWIENDSGGGGFSSGNYFVTAGTLQFGESSSGRWIYREADLSGATAASFSFDVTGNNFGGGGDISVQISGNGGTSYTTLTHITQATGTGTLSFDISSYIAADTRIRFYDNAGGGKEIFLDNIQITVMGNSGTTSAFSATTQSASITVNAVSDAPVAVDDKNSLYFDGVDDYVMIADSPSLTMTNTMTLEAWINPDASTNLNRMIINKEGEYELALFADGSLAWGLANTDPGWSWHNTGYVVADDVWSHIAVSYDNGTVSTYVNGSLVDVYNGSGPIGDSHATLDEVRIGGRSNNPAGQYFEGQIDDVRIWNSARTEVEINTNLDLTLTGAEAGLVGYWTFDEGAGTLANDLTANANHGALTDGAATGAPIWSGYTTDQNTQINITAANGIVSNDVDNDGDPLTVTQVNGSGANVGSSFTLASGANLTVGTLGAFIYNPNGAFDYLVGGESATDSFTYTIADGNGGTDSARAYITVTGVEDAPTDIAPNSFNVDENTDTSAGYNLGLLTHNDPDNSNTFTYSIFAGVDAVSFSLGGAGGNELILTAGVLDFESQPSYAVTVRVDDGTTTYDEALTVFVNDVNDAPVAVADSFTVDEGSTTTLNLASNDNDVDDGLDLTSIAIVGAPANGSVVVNANGTVDYTNDGSATASDSFTYTIDDMAGVTSNTVTVSLTVTPVGDTPQVANITTDEDTQSGLIVIDRNVDDGTEVTHFRISGISNGALYQADGTTSISDNDYITYAQAQAGLRFTPAANSTASGSFAVESSDDGSTVAAQSGVATSTITVTPVGDTPQVADITTNEDTQSALIVINRNANDGAEVTHFRISGITGGTLFQADGTTSISDNDYITYAQAQAGLRFTPVANSTASGNFSVESSEDGSTVAAQSTAATSTITVTPVGDTPQVADITTDEDTQSAPIVIDRNANDGAEVTHFRISGITGGALFQADGTTAIANGDYINFAQGQAGLRFTPSLNSTANGSFNVESSENGISIAAQSIAATSTITVTPVGDTPQVANITTDEDTQSGPIVIDRNANDGAEVTHFRISGITGGALFQADGTTAIANGDYITFAQGQAGLRFTPSLNSTANGSFSVESSEDSSTVAAQSTAATSTITVTPVGDTPQVADITTDEDTQSGLIVIDRNVDDGTEVTHFRISGITGGGLFQADGTTSISDNDYISYAQAQAGLRFTPVANSTASGSFGVESSEDGSTVAAQSTAATSTITVTPVGDTPQVANITTNEDTQSGPIVIDRNANDGAEVTHFRISGITGGALFQADGTTSISDNDYITYAQAQAGLRFTPSLNSTANGSFNVESSENGISIAAQSIAATSTITVTPVGDTPQVADITTDEDTQSGLIVIDRNAADGAEVTHFRISGISNGAVFQADGSTAINDGDYITFAQAQAGLRFTPSANSTAAGSFAVESSENGTSVATQSGIATSTITVTPVGDTPQVADITTNEDTQSAPIVIDRNANDGAEVTHFRISGISNGALFQADGTTSIANGDYITFAQGQSGLRFTPAANSTANGSFAIESSEDGSTVAAQSGIATSTITVTPVGDTPQVANIATDEDTQSGLIVIDRNASDGAEVTHFRISGITGGALFQADGTTSISDNDYITYAQAQAGLRFTPVANSTASGNFSVESSEDGSTVAAQSTAATSTITVTPVGDTPQVADITTDEDTQSAPIVIDRNATDGAEVTHFRISGITGGALFQADGTTSISDNDYITYAQAQAGLRFTPVANSTASGNFSVESSEDGSTVAAQSTAATSTITVTPVGDTPQVADITTDEDTQSAPIVIDRNATDGAEVTHFRISGITGGALFQADGTTAIANGDYITFAQGQAGLRFTPDTNSTASGSFAAESSENGTSVAAQSGIATSTITVTPVGDTPQVANITTDEDTQSGLIVIDRNAADGAEVTHFRVSGITGGALFQADGTTSISDNDYITYAQAQAGLRFTPGLNSTANGSFNVESSEDGTSVAAQSAVATSAITVTPVGDTPQVLDITTNEDTQSGPIVIDRNASDGAEVTHFRISGITGGALFQADGTTSISDNDYITYAQAQAGLRFTPDTNSTAVGSFAVESSENGTSVAAQSGIATSTITVTPVGDTPQVANIATDEDTQSGLIVIDRNASDGAEVTHFRISGITGGALFQADGTTSISDNDYITYAQAQAGLRFTPDTNSTAVGSFAVESSENGTSVAAQSGIATSTITVTPVGDTPQVANIATDEDTQSGLIVIDRNASDGAEVTHFRISGITGGALFQADGTTSISDNDYITYAQAQAGLRFTPDTNSTAAGSFAVESSENGTSVAAQSGIATSTITVTPVGDTPQVANITTDEDTQSGLIVIDRNATDGAEVTHFRISGISNGALFQADGSTAINDGDYITFAQGQAGLRFTPAANSTASGSFAVESSEDGSTVAAQSGVAISTITVTPVGDTPQVADITTDEDTQSGLIVIDRNAADGAEVTHFRISGITGGALFQADGTTSISDNEYITYAQAQAGLRFTPAANATASGSFSVESSEDGSTVAAQSTAATSTMTVTPVGDTPQVANITTNEDTQSGLIVIDRNANDGAEVTHFRISGITGGALFQADGTTSISDNDYITYAQAQAGLRFTPAANSTANGSFNVESSEDGSTVAAQSGMATSTITVTPVGDTPQVANITTDEDTQSGLIVIDRNANDGAEVTHFRISGISNGALFQADGTTSIANGDYITFAQGQAGLRFTPAANSTASGSFAVESSDDGSTVAAQSGVATSTITVTPVGDTPQVADITTDEDTQSAPIVIDRNANDGAEVTHFRISGITGGALFQADGTTSISDNEYITYAQAQAGLRFTPAANATASGSFSVESSEDGSTVAAQSGVATSTITVTPVGDTPQVADITTDEDTQSGLIVIDRNAADGAEVTHFRISGISNGALFQADGSTAINDGDYITFAQAQAGLRFTPSANSTAAGSFAVESSENGTSVATQSGIATSTITVTPVGDTPQVADITTNEDTQSAPIVIDRNAADGVEVTHFRISGISNGALFQADGTTAISDNDYITYAQAQAGLRFTPDTNSTAAGSFAVESSEDGSTVAAQSGVASSTITVTPVGDTPQVADITTDEDTQSGLIVIDRNAADGAEVTHFRISGITGGALFQADGTTSISDNEYITYAQAQAGLRFTPAANATASGSFSVESSEDGSTVAAQSTAATSTITVTPVGDTPQVANITTNEDTQSGLIVIDRNTNDGAEVTHFRISGITGGALFQADGTTAISDNEYITYAQAQAGLRFTPVANSTASGNFSVESSEDGSTVAAQSTAATSTITVTPVGDTPQVADITTDEDTQSAPIVIDRNATDGAEVTHFRISGITGGALFQADGTTAIANGDYITFAQGQAGLRFTPDTNSTASGSFAAESSENGTSVAAQSAAATSTITVTPVGDTPQVADITTNEDTQSALIVINRNANDGAEVTHFRISGITGGTLFQADGTTSISDNDYITYAQAQAGLRFTPVANSTASGNFSVESSEDGSTVAAQSTAATSTITVTPVGDTPQVADITTDEDTQSAPIVIDRNANDGAEVTHFRISGITGGALFQADGTTAIANGDYINFAQGQAGLRFTPSLNSTANGSFNVESSENGISIAAQSIAATSTITVTPVGDTPQVANITTDEDTQSGPIVIDRNANDGAEVTHFRISGITGGALFQADGTTAIANGDYITFAQGQAGLRFTPSLNSTANGSFSVESSEDSSTVAAQSTAATSTITVTPVGDTPQVADITTDEDTQSGLIVIDRNVDDGTEVTHFRISGITGGGLFQADGTTSISDNDYISYAQAQAGLRFTPVANSTASGSFGVESSEDGSTVAAQSTAATSTITVTPVGDTPQVANITTNEDTQSGPIVIDRNANDGAEVTHFRISGITGGALFQADGTTSISDNDYITYAQAQAGLRFTPSLNSTANGSFNVESSENGISIAAQSIAATSTITVTPVGDTPQVADITTDEDTQSGLIVIDRNAADGAEVTHFRISGISNGAVFQADGSTAINDGDYITFAQAQAGLRFTPSANSTAAGSFAVESSENGTSVATQSGIATSTITVTPVGDTPQVADITTNEDTQSAPIVIDRNANDGAEVTHFRISGISNGALFQADGTTSIANGDYITFAQGQSGLRFTPAANSTANGSFAIESSEDGSTVAAQSGIATSTITVTPVGDTPQVANIATDEDTQSGLIVIDRNASDGAEVTHFRISGITGGALFQADGTTSISDNDYITYAQAQAGLRFTPVANSTASGNFSVESSEDGSTVAAQSTAATSTITVTPVGDTPQVADITTDEDTQSAPIVIDRNATDGAEVTHFRISGITGGALFQADGTTAIANGDYITFAQGQAGLRFTPDTNSTASGSFAAESSENGTSVAAQSGIATSTITVTPVGDTPQVANITTDEDTQSGLIVIDRNAADGAEVTHFRVSGITGGALFQADGTTSISDNDYITYAQAQAGLRFTPGLNSTANGSFNVESSEDGTSVAAQSAVATSAITVTPVGDTPQVLDITTNEDTQSGPIVIDRNASDGAEVTHFRISGITGGALFQADGTTSISDNDYITYAQAQAGLRFTPDTNSTAVGSFAVESSENGTSVAAQSGIATSTITVTPVGDTPQVANIATDEDTQSGLIVIDRNASDGAEVTHFRISGITGGALFQADGTTSISDNDYITYAQAQAGLRFTPDTNSTAVGSFAVESSENGTSVAAQSGIATSTITVTPVGDTPQVANIATDEDTQSGLIVIDRNASDGAEVTHFRISAITGGALFHADGTTSISDNDYITYAQGQAGLRFTPNTNSISNGTFNVESSENGATIALQSGVATSTITVTAVNDSPAPDNNSLTVNEGQSVILTSADLSATDPDNGDDELTFTVSGIQNGLFERISDGTAVTSFTQADINAGEIRFVHNGSELAPAYEITISDGALGTAPSAAAITFSANANDAPVLATQIFNIDENSANGFSVGIVAFSDVDANDNHQFAITGGPAAAAFVIDSSTGEITVNDSNLLDFEKNPSLEIRVQVMDDGTSALSAEATITVQLNDLAEFDISVVEDTDSAADVIDVHAAIGTPVGIAVHAVDANSEDTITYSLDADAGGLFVIDSTTGIITLNAELEIQGAKSYSIVARAASSDGSFSTQQFEITVYDSNNKFVNSVDVTTDVDDGSDRGPTAPSQGPDNEPGSGIVDNTTTAANENSAANYESDEPDPYDRRRTGNAATNKPAEAGIQITDEQIEQAISELVGQAVPPSTTEHEFAIEKQGRTVDLKKPQLQQNSQQRSAPEIDSLALNSVLNDHALWEQLEIMRQEMDDSPAAGADNELVVQIVSGSTVALTAGFVSWVLRGGSLLASLMSTLPLWKGFDPLPILATKDEEDASLRPNKNSKEQNGVDALFDAENGKLPHSKGRANNA